MSIRARLPSTVQPPPLPIKAPYPLELFAPEDQLRLVMSEAIHLLGDAVRLGQLTPITKLRVVQERWVRRYSGSPFGEELAACDVMREAVEHAIEVLPHRAAVMLRALAESRTAADAAVELGEKPAALRKYATPRIEEALVRYFEHLESRYVQAQDHSSPPIEALK